MKEQAKLKINHSRGTYSKLELPARVLLFLFVLLLLAVITLAAPMPASAEVSVGVSVTIGPPPIPVYTQPLCPGPGFIWIPGYWAWDPEFGYYWVPGMWAPAPFVGALWTPGYWAWNNGLYLWHDGYWGLSVGFYGGINYGYGYTGYGYYGGYWSGGRYYYNRTVNNISVTNITTVYSRPVRYVRPAGPSFHGGRGGTIARPTSEQLAAARDRRASITSEQRHQMQVARENPEQRVTVNRGRPAIVATPKPGVFTGRGVVRSHRAKTPGTVPRGREVIPGERSRAPGPRVEAQSPTGTHERMAPGTQRRGSEPRYSEPGQRPPSYEPGTGQRRPKTTAPRQQKGNSMSERGETRGSR